jgi:hypothetical protein
MKYDMPYNGFKPVPAVCPGPNLIYFSRILSLKEMIDHIYGRINVLNPQRVRPHVFINELRLYVNYLKDLVLKASVKMSSKEADTFAEFRKNLREGIEYYKNMASAMVEESELSRGSFRRDLAVLTAEVEEVHWACLS